MNQAGLDLFAALNVHTCPRISNYYILGGSYLNQENVSKDFIFTLPSDYNIAFGNSWIRYKISVVVLHTNSGCIKLHRIQLQILLPISNPFYCGRRELVGSEIVLYTNKSVLRSTGYGRT